MACRAARARGRATGSIGAPLAAARASRRPVRGRLARGRKLNRYRGRPRIKARMYDGLALSWPSQISGVPRRTAATLLACCMCLSNRRPCSSDVAAADARTDSIIEDRAAVCAGCCHGLGIQHLAIDDTSNTTELHGSFPGCPPALSPAADLWRC